MIGEMNCSLDSLSGSFKNAFDHLVVSASYEERAFGVWQHLRGVIPGRRFVCFNENHISYLDESLRRFKSDDADIEVVPLDSDHPLATFDALRTALHKLSESGPCRIAVDVTGFTREALAILLYLFRYQLPAGSTVTAFYHRAQSYGRTRVGGWLSQGVQEVRSILGYAGVMELGAETHLMLLAGFEFERAHEIIDAVQPTRISLGQVSSDASSPLNQCLNLFMARLESFYAGTHFDRFDFSPLDPFLTRDSLLDFAKGSMGNVVCASLNSKPATVGACLAALENPTIQLVYAQPICYNVADYSKPSGTVFSFQVPLWNSIDPLVISDQNSSLITEQDVVLSGLGHQSRASNFEPA